MTLAQFIEKIIVYSDKNKEELSRLFEIYLKELQETNKVMNLTSITETNDVVEKHFYDSSLVFNYFDLKNRTILDVGTGGGFPGLVLAIIDSRIEVTLLDSNLKKINFLDKLVKILDLKNVKTIVGRVEEKIVKEESYDYVVSRAVAPLRILTEICSYPLKVSGHFLCMKSKKFEDELKESKNIISKMGLELESTFKDTLPSNDDLRILLDFKKLKRTPEGFPRSYSQILKKPI